MLRPLLPLLLLAGPVLAQPTPAPSVSTNGALSCGIVQARAICWGRAVPWATGQPRPDPSTGTTEWDPAPIPGDPGFVTIAAGGGLTACGLTATGELWCVGQNSRHPMGPFTAGSGAVECSGLTCAARPVRVAAPLRFKAFANGHQTACGISLEGRLYCWGLNEEGQVGAGRGRAVTHPVPLLPTLRFKAVGTSDYHGCALTEAGEAWCWGSADGTQMLGTGDSTYAVWRPGPHRVRTSLRFTSLSVAYQVSCALTQEGEAWCWGWNNDDWMGIGPSAECMGGGNDCVLAPRAVGNGVRFRELKVGIDAACGITLGGTISCIGAWGPAGPVMPPKLTVRTIGVSGNQGCAVTDREEVYCWGGEANGRPASRPTRRVFPSPE